MSDTLPVKIIYRSRGISYSLIAAIEDCDAWSRVGLDPGDEVAYVEGAANGDRMLQQGEVQFIFGSHVTPYLRYAEGIPFTYLGQSVNWTDDILVTRTPIDGVPDVRGLRLTERLERETHPRGNRVLYLRRAGIAEDEVTWVDRAGRPALDVVADGDADAAFIQPLDAPGARKRGLAVHTPDPLPMVVSATMTTLWPVVRDQPEVCKRVLRAVRLGIKHFKSEPDAMAKVMRNKVAPTLGIDDEEVLDLMYERNSRLLEEDLYPRIESITNAFALAVRLSPGLADKVKPTALWDLHFLRELDAE